MKKKQKKPKPKENAERWLLTYSDLMNLLLVLFILLYSMSTVDAAKYADLSSSLNEALGAGASLFGDGSGGSGVLPGGDTAVNIDNNGGGNDSSQTTIVPTSTPEPTETPAATGTPEVTAVPADTTGNQATGELSGTIENEKEMVKLETYVDDILADMDIGVSAKTTMAERGLVITFANDAFFDSGDDTLKTNMKKGLNNLAKLLNKIDNSIIIEGHTDNVPVGANNKYASNWLLSAARAANVAQYLAVNEKIDGTRIAAVGYGEYRPVASNDSEKGRSQNRRVDIIIRYNDKAEVGY